jgi:DNA topoisomerase-1
MDSGIKKRRIQIENNTRILGKNPKTKNKIIAMVKKYDPVVMEIEDLEDNKEKIINTAPIKLPLTTNLITLEEALELLSYPKLLGEYDRKKVWLKRGKFGLYVSYGDENISFKNVDYKNESELTIEKIVEIIEQKIKENNEKFAWQGKNGKVSYVVLKSKFEIGSKYLIVETDEENLIKRRVVPLPNDIDPKILTVEKVKEIVDNYFAVRKFSTIM